MRSLFGRLNKFHVAPGSISDLKSGGLNYELADHEIEHTPVGKW